MISLESFGFVGETLGGDTKRPPANDAADCSVLVLEALVLEGETSRVHRGRAVGISLALLGFVGETLGGDTKRSPADDATG